MMEPLFHLFVWIVSPAAVGGTAVYALIKREFFLGAFASASVLLFCAGTAMWMFDEYLLSYQLIYTALISVPVLLFVVAAVRAVVHLGKFLVRNVRPASTD